MKGCQPAERRHDHIDCIRGIAAMAVVIFHVTLALASVGHHRALLDLVSTGWFDLGKWGVVLFFALSGYLVPRSFNPCERHPVQRFIVRRSVRLYPAYWLSMSLAVLVLPAVSDQSFSPSTILANATMMQQFVGAANVLGCYWTLQIEITFYVLVAAVFAARPDLRRLPARKLCGCTLILALILAGLRGALHAKLPVALPLGLCVMFAGACWREHQSSGAHVEARRLLAECLLLAIGILAVCRLAYSFDAGGQENWVRYGVTYLAALAAFASLTTFAKIGWAPFAGVGRASYSLYLLSPIVQALAETVGLHHAHPAVFAVAVVGFSLLAAAASHRYVESVGARAARELSSPAKLAA
jgi:peptidoglycan/LPS O-acetylase OafA/YrhL